LAKDASKRAKSMYAYVEKFRAITYAPFYVRSEEKLLAEIRYNIFTNV
jgi:hypothetical protein